MKMKNRSGRELVVPGDVIAGSGLTAAQKYTIEDGAEVEVKDGYALPRRATNGSRIPSVVERLAPGLEPADEGAVKEWRKTPEVNPEVKPVVPTPAQLQAQGISPGAAAIMAAKAEAAAKQKAPEPKPAPEPAPTPAPEPEPLPEVDTKADKPSKGKK